MPDPIHVPPSAPARLVVLASGTGSLLQSLVEASVGDYPARVVAVGVDRDCPAEHVAAAAQIPSYRVRLGDYPDRCGWDSALTAATARGKADSDHLDEMRRREIEGESRARKDRDEIERLTKLLTDANAAADLIFEGGPCLFQVRYR